MFNKAKIFQIQILSIVTAMLIISCSANNANNDNEIQLLKDQVNLLGTQNAILSQPGTSPENQLSSEEVQAPPPPLNEQVTQIDLITPTPDTLPAGPVPAGEPILYQGWALTVSKELIIYEHKDAWGITIFLRNMGDTKRVFRFKNSGITAIDTLGNVYEMSTNVSVAGLGSESCEVTYHSVKNIEVRDDSILEISSGKLGYTNCSLEDGIHAFEGPIPLDVSQLIIHFEEFGPYHDVDVTIDL